MYPFVNKSEQLIYRFIIVFEIGLFGAFIYASTVSGFNIVVILLAFTLFCCSFIIEGYYYTKKLISHKNQFQMQEVSDYFKTKLSNHFWLYNKRNVNFDIIKFESLLQKLKYNKKNAFTYYKQKFSNFPNLFDLLKPSVKRYIHEIHLFPDLPVSNDTIKENEDYKIFKTLVINARNYNELNEEYFRKFCSIILISNKQIFDIVWNPIFVSSNNFHKTTYFAKEIKGKPTLIYLHQNSIEIARVLSSLLRR